MAGSLALPRTPPSTEDQPHDAGGPDGQRHRPRQPHHSQTQPTAPSYWVHVAQKVGRREKYIDHEPGPVPWSRSGRPQMLEPQCARDAVGVGVEGDQKKVASSAGRSLAI